MAIDTNTGENSLMFNGRIGACAYTSQPLSMISPVPRLGYLLNKLYTTYKFPESSDKLLPISGTLPTSIKCNVGCDCSSY